VREDRVGFLPQRNKAPGVFVFVSRRKIIIKNTKRTNRILQISDKESKKFSSYLDL
jgi:hypothetical protein